MKRPELSLTLALWLLNGLAWLVLIVVSAWRFQEMLVPDPVLALHLEPTSMIDLPKSDVITKSRNPFDANGTPWRKEVDGDVAHGSKQLKGIIVLPGVGVALTDHGSAKMGDAISQGVVVSVGRRGIAVALTKDDEKPTVLLPESERLTMQDLNRNGKSTPPSDKTTPIRTLNQGQP